MGEVEDHHAGEEISPEEGFVGELFVGVEKENLLSVLASEVVGRHVDQGFGTLTEEATGGSFLLADDEVDEKALAHLLGSKEGDHVEVAVVFVQGEEIDELIVEFQLTGTSVGSQYVDNRVCGLALFGLVEHRVLLHGLLSGDRCQDVVIALIEKRCFFAVSALVHFKIYNQ